MKTPEQIKERIQELEKEIERLNTIHKSRLWTEDECFDYDAYQNTITALRWVLENEGE